MQIGNGRGLGLVIGIVCIAAVLVGCASGSADDGAGTATGAATATEPGPATATGPGTENGGASSKEDWVTQWGADTPTLRLAMNVKSADPFTFALSAIDPNTPAHTVDAHDLTADFTDGTGKSVHFAKGDCTIALELGDAEVKLVQTGPCTSIGVPDGMKLDADLSVGDEMCWDGAEHAFKQSGEACTPPEGF
jgi:hypothetical protein